MEIKVIQFSPSKKELLDKAFEIRTKVFVEEQKVNKEIEYDGYDDEAVHYLVYFNEKAVGTGRRRITQEGHKLERYAVSREYRGKNVGAALIEFMLNELLPTEKKIYLNAQAQVERFYKKFGFKREGESFMEADIKHYKMVYSPQKK